MYLCGMCLQMSSFRNFKQGKNSTNNLDTKVVKSDFNLPSSCFDKRYSLFSNWSISVTSGVLSSKWLEGILSVGIKTARYLIPAYAVHSIIFCVINARHFFSCICAGINFELSVYMKSLKIKTMHL